MESEAESEWKVQGALRSSVNQKSESEAESEARRNRSQKDQKSSSFSSDSASASVASDPVRTGCKGNQCGNMSDNGENSAEDSTMKVKALKAEKRKLKAAITRQLNELAGRVAGVSSGVEPRGLEEMESIKATFRKLRKKFRNTGRITDIVSATEGH